MKKVILLFIFFGFSQTINALQIENITVSAISNQQLNVKVNTMNLYTFAFNSHQYNIVGNNIILEICFNAGVGAAISYSENTFQIPLNTIAVANYTLTVKVYYISFQTFTCDYQVIQDTKSLNFSTPLAGMVSLSNNNFSQNRLNSVFYPNPTSGSLLFDKTLKIENIQIYNSLGQLISRADAENEYDLSSLQNGLYFVRFNLETNIYTEKIILKK